MNELKLVENGLIKVYTTDTGEYVVNGRELWQGLESKQDFSNWVKNRLGECDAVEDEGFSIILSKTSEQGGRPAKEYIIKLDTAKEMAMLERNDVGKQYRRYFIEVEKKYKSNDGFNVIKDMVIQDLQNGVLKDIQESITTLAKSMTILINNQIQPQTQYQSNIKYDFKSEDDNRLYTISDIAKEYDGMSAKKLNIILRDLGIQYRNENKEWRLTGSYDKKGYIIMKTGRTTKGITYNNMRWTGYGKQFINGLLEEKLNIIPVRRMMRV